MRDGQVIKDDGAKIEKLILEVLLDIRELLSTTLTEPKIVTPKEVKPKKRKKRKIKTV